MSQLIATVSTAVVHASLQAIAGFAVGGAIDVLAAAYSVPIGDLAIDAAQKKWRQALGLFAIQTCAQFALMALSTAACIYLSMNIGLSSDPSACVTFILAQYAGSYMLQQNLSDAAQLYIAELKSWLYPTKKSPGSDTKAKQSTASLRGRSVLPRHDLNATAANSSIST